MRVLLPLALALGCSTPHYTSGSLRCAPAGKACPDNFFCGPDQRCWAIGSGPDMEHVVASRIEDLAAPVGDLAGADLTAATSDLSRADLARTADATMIPLLQLGPVATGSSSLTLTLPAPSRAGTLLVMTFTFNVGNLPQGTHAGCTTCGASNWTYWQGQSSANESELWFLPSNPGGITSETVKINSASGSVGQISEWTVFSTQDQGGWCWQSSAVTTWSCATQNADAHDLDLGLVTFSTQIGSAAAITTSPSSGWVNLGNNDGAATRLHYSFDYALDLAQGTIPTASSTSTSAATWAGAIVSLH